MWDSSQVAELIDLTHQLMVKKEYPKQKIPVPGQGFARFLPMAQKSWPNHEHLTSRSQN